LRHCLNNYSSLLVFFDSIEETNVFFVLILIVLAYQVLYLLIEYEFWIFLQKLKNMGEYLADSDPCGRHILSLVSRGHAIIAELQRLSDFVPVVFQNDGKRGNKSP
jgi:hypothetical protein